MTRLRWLVAIPVVLATALLAPASQAAAIRDTAEMFSKDVVKKARARLDRLESTTGIPIVIETIDEIPGIDKDASESARRKAIDALAVRRDEAIKDEGIYILISKRDHVISHVLVRERLVAVASDRKARRHSRCFHGGVQEARLRRGPDARRGGDRALARRRVGRRRGGSSRAGSGAGAASRSRPTAEN